MPIPIIPHNQLLSLEGKTAIVTGSVGIGYGIGYRLAEAGANVILVGRRQEEVTESAVVLSRKGWNVAGIRGDVSREDDVKHLVTEVVERFGQIDILVNNAGIYPNTPLASMSSADFDSVIATNLRGVFLCTKYVAEQMILQGRGGRIINITSIDALHPSYVGLAHYDASKHGVWGFTKNVALELSAHKIWVNAIAPGGVLTPGVHKVTQGKINDEFLNSIPMKRMGEPDDIGKVALFLASDMAGYMTGSQIVVDGGVLLS